MHTVHRIRECLTRLRLDAEDAGLWPGAEPSLPAKEERGASPLLEGLLELAWSCDVCHGRLLPEPPTPTAGPRKLTVRLGREPWWEDLELAVSAATAVVVSVAEAWKIAGLIPGEHMRPATWNGAPFDQERLLQLRRSAPRAHARLAPLPARVATAIDRCLRRFDLAFATERTWLADGYQMGDEEPLTPEQHRVLELLDRSAMSLLQIANELGKDQSWVHVNVLKPLMNQKRIKNARKLGGYYRPDAPPEVTTRRH